MVHITSRVQCDFSLQSFFPTAAHQPHLVYADFLFPPPLPEPVLSHVITLYRTRALLCSA